MGSSPAAQALRQARRPWRRGCAKGARRAAAGCCSMRAPPDLCASRAGRIFIQHMARRPRALAVAQRGARPSPQASPRRHPGRLARRRARAPRTAPGPLLPPPLPSPVAVHAPSALRGSVARPYAHPACVRTRLLFLGSLRPHNFFAALRARATPRRAPPPRQGRPSPTGQAPAKPPNRKRGPGLRGRGSRAAAHAPRGPVCAPLARPAGRHPPCLQPPPLPLKVAGRPRSRWPRQTLVASAATPGAAAATSAPAPKGPWGGAARRAKAAFRPVSLFVRLPCARPCVPQRLGRRSMPPVRACWEGAGPPRAADVAAARGCALRPARPPARARAHPLGPCRAHLPLPRAAAAAAACFSGNPPRYSVRASPSAPPDPAARPLPPHGTPPGPIPSGGRGGPPPDCTYC
jgi:hypothetical protein